MYEDQIQKFVNFQRGLVLEFLRQHQNSKDTKWLLDFPAKGRLSVNGCDWKFVKHGAGVRFKLDDVTPGIVVDIHDNFDRPSVIDTWRLRIFFESVGINLTDDQLSELMSEGCLKKQMTDLGFGKYEVHES